MDTNVFMQNIEKINMKLKSGKGLVDSELLVEFENNYINLSNNIQDIYTEGRNLRIGIVGAVKAGKSTFLNSLLFDGKEVLPKAPTPMTAALTKVRYADVPSAKIVFYSMQEWNKIEEKAEEYKDKINKLLKDEERIYKQQMQTSYGSTKCGGFASMSYPTYESVEAKNRENMPVDLCSCNELVQMLDRNGIRASEYLKQGEITIANVDDFNQQLNEYVGVDGVYTPIVKYTELSINNELLKDLEIVDTPGLNDPILSRSKKTQDFLLQCDVVFVLSYVGQFLTSDDMVLIKNVLPAEGINYVVIVASKFDSGILDYKKRGAAYEEAVKNTVRTIKKSFFNQMAKMEKSGEISYSMLKILQATDILFASGLMFGIAKKLENKEKLNEEEEHIYNTFKKRFDDFDGSIDGLYDLSGMNNIKNRVINKLKKEKDEIVHRRITEFLFTQESKFSKLLEDINVDLRKNLNDINQYAYETLQKKSKKLSANLDSVRKSINMMFSNAAINAEKQMQNIISQVNDEMENYRDMEIGSKRIIEHETVRKGVFGILREDVQITKDVKTVEVNATMENIKRYCAGIHRIIIADFEHLIDIEGLKKDIKEKVQSAFDTTDKDFDPEEIAITLNQMVGNLTIPEITLDAEKYMDMMLSRFPEFGLVEGETKISELKIQQSIVLQKMFSDIRNELLMKSNMLYDQLNKCAGNFIDDVEKKMLDAIKLVQKLLGDKEESIKKLEIYKETVSECKQVLHSMERE